MLTVPGEEMMETCHREEIVGGSLRANYEPWPSPQEMVSSRAGRIRTSLLLLLFPLLFPFLLFPISPPPLLHHHHGPQFLTELINISKGSLMTPSLNLQRKHNHLSLKPKVDFCLCYRLPVFTGSQQNLPDPI